jgi:hypothetical protein
MKNYEFPIEYVHAQCRIVAQCFVQSANAGYDSDDFAKKFMTTDYGVMVITDHRMIEYSDANFMFEGFQRELKFKQGTHYTQDVLELAGYLYKYWVSTRGADPRKIYIKAPISLINTRYGFYHTQDLDYVIDDIECRPAN